MKNFKIYTLFLLLFGSQLCAMGHVSSPSDPVKPSPAQMMVGLLTSYAASISAREVQRAEVQKAIEPMANAELPLFNQQLVRHLTLFPRFLWYQAAMNVSLDEENLPQWVQYLQERYKVIYYRLKDLLKEARKTNNAQNTVILDKLVDEASRGDYSTLAYLIELIQDSDYLYDQVIRFMLAKIDINAHHGSYQTTPLLTIAREGHPAAIRAFLAVGADVNARDLLGFAPLHEACRDNSADAVRVLLGAGADPYVRTTGEMDPSGNTPLHMACWHNKVDIVKAFIALGLDLNVRNDDGKSPLDITVIDIEDDSAALALINGGADLNAPDKKGNTAFHHACCVSWRNMHFWKKKHLIQAFIDAGADLKACNNDGETPFHVACRCREVDEIRALLAAGADVNAPSKSNTTPLQIAVKYNSMDVVQALIEARADLNAWGEGAHTALHTAALNNRVDGVNVLINAGANRRARNIRGMTPLDSVYESVCFRPHLFPGHEDRDKIIKILSKPWPVWVGCISAKIKDMMPIHLVSRPL